MPDEVLIPDRRALMRLFPGLRLVGAIRQAFDFRKVVIAASGLVALQMGWSLLNQLMPAAVVTPDLFASSLMDAPGAGPWDKMAVSSLTFRLTEPFRLLATPLFALFSPGTGWGRMLHALLSLIWLMIVWGLCGGAIARIAIVQATAFKQTGIVAALRFARKHASTLIMAPLCPLLGVGSCAVLGALYGVLYRLPTIGPVLGGIGLIVPLAGGFVMTLLIAGLLAGWPLLQAATAGGAEDALDALSRTFGYLNQRLGAYAALIALAWLGGMLGLALLDLLTTGVVQLTTWSLGLTTPIDLANVVASSPAGSLGALAAVAHGFWLGVVRLLAHGWIYGYFWTAASYIYLWLRFDVDGQPWNAIEP